MTDLSKKTGPIVRVNVDDASQVELVFTNAEGGSEILTAADFRDLKKTVARLTSELDASKDERSCLPWNDVLTKAGVRRINANADANFVKMYCLQHGLDYWTFKTAGPQVRGIPSRLSSDFVEQYKRFEKADGASKRTKTQLDSDGSSAVGASDGLEKGVTPFT